MEKSKILVQVVTPVLARLNDKIKAVGLRRDVYLNIIFQDEVKLLDSELGELCNSALSREYLSSELRKLPLTGIGLTLEAEVANGITQVCGRHNIARDCFVNRVLFLLAAEDRHLDAMGIPRSSVKMDPYQFSSNALDNASLLLHDPFFDIRKLITETYPDQKMHTWQFSKYLTGLNCYLSDEFVPGTPEFADLESILDI